MKRIVVYMFATIMMLSFAAFADVIVIANRDVPEDTLSQKDVQEIFLGKKVQWSDHSRVHCAVVGDDQVHGKFLKLYVKLSKMDWKIYWKRMVFTGRGLPPETRASEAELIEYISRTKGSVGYISSEGMPEKSENNTVKIIDVR